MSGQDSTGGAGVAPPAPDAPGPDAPAPDALVEDAPVRRTLASLAWLIPVAALLLSVGFAVRAMQDRGPTIVILADHGHGIGPGDSLRYLGMQVGEVRRVALDEVAGADAVRIEVLMRADAAELARDGTLFWVVRPQLSLDSVQGLETIIGAQYLALHPGPAGAGPREEFTALVAPPLADELTSRRGLELVLEAPSRYGLQPGAGVSYRGVRIGSVTAVGLASDASSVEVRVRIRRAFAQLVRERSVFWETGGVELGLSITSGFQLDLDSLRTALIGGISMATPLDAGDAVPAGSRFALAPDAEEEWLDWAPALPVGNDLLPAQARLPRLVRATLAWTEGRVLRTDEQRVGWMVVVEGQGLVAPADLLTVPEDAREGRARLEVAGKTFDLATIQNEGLVVEHAPALLRLRSVAMGEAWTELSAAHQGELEGSRRALIEPEDLIVVREGGRAPLAIDESRLLLEGDGLRVDSGLPLTADWHGAVVMARGDGAVGGILLVSDQGTRIVPLP